MMDEEKIILNFIVKDRIIKFDKSSLTEKVVGDNTGYVANFIFDEEWTNKVKTARFIKNSTYVDMVLDDNDQCDIPLEVLKSGTLEVGVFAGNLRSSTSCKVNIKSSILESNGLPAAPTDDVYAQIIEKVEAIESVKKAVINDDGILVITLTSGIELNVGKARGVGIKSFEQTKSSTEDSGENEFLVTLTDDTKFSFKIQNGSKGSTGDAIVSLNANMSVNELNKTYIRSLIGNSITFTFDDINGAKVGDLAMVFFDDLEKGGQFITFNQISKIEGLTVTGMIKGVIEKGDKGDKGNRGTNVIFLKDGDENWYDKATNDTGFTAKVKNVDDIKVGDILILNFQFFTNSVHFAEIISISEFDETEQCYFVEAEGRGYVEDGITPNLSIGTVETVSPTEKASATLTGTTEKPVLNFSLVKGDTGVTPNISIGTIETVKPNESASATMTGTAENPRLNLKVPKGETGLTPNLSIGTVSTVAPTESASATMTGTKEEPVLNLSIPRGADSDINTWDLIEQAANFMDYNTGVLSDEQVKAGYFSILQTAGYTNVRSQLERVGSPFASFHPKDDAVFPKKIVFGLKTDEYLNFTNVTNYEKYSGITDVIFDYSDSNVMNITVSNADWTGLKGIVNSVRSIVYPKTIGGFGSYSCARCTELEKLVFFNVGSFGLYSFDTLPKLKKLHFPIGAGDWKASTSFRGVTLDELTVDKGFHSTIYVSSVLKATNENASFLCHAIIENLADLSGYTLTTEEPADWSTNYTSYYTEADGVYTQVTGDTVPDWAENTYYSANEGKPIYFGPSLLSLIDDEHKLMLNYKNWDYQ